jgi:hypothetical protein
MGFEGLVTGDALEEDTRGVRPWSLLQKTTRRDEQSLVPFVGPKLFFISYRAEWIDRYEHCDQCRGSVREHGCYGFHVCGSIWLGTTPLSHVVERMIKSNGSIEGSAIAALLTTLSNT